MLPVARPPQGARCVLAHVAGVAPTRAARPAPPPARRPPPGLAPELPEDLYHLIKKAVAMRKHLEANRKDKDGALRRRGREGGTSVVGRRPADRRRPPTTGRCYAHPAAGKFHLILVESRIHRLARYYKKCKRLPPNWK